MNRKMDKNASSDRNLPALSSFHILQCLTTTSRLETNSQVLPLGHNQILQELHEKNLNVCGTINPFDTEHRAKTAIKFSILRMVMLWFS